MSKEEFYLHLKTDFAPKLRGVGFIGSGSNFRRLRNDVIHVLNIQGSKYGESSCVNLCIHPSCLPIEHTQELPDPKKLKEYECVFRSRLAPASGVDKWWKYNGIFTSPKRSVDDLVTTYFKYGESYLDRYSSVKNILEELSIDKLRANKSIEALGWDISIPRAALIAARISECRGDDESKVLFAKYGLGQVECGEGLKKLLLELL